VRRLSGTSFVCIPFRHAETAAGLFGVIKAIEMLRRRTYLPTGGLKKPRTDFDWGVRYTLALLIMP
jgi:hypothetical protein